MQRHNLSVFSLLCGGIFAAGAIVLFATDGRFTSYNLHWTTVGIVASGVIGVGLIAAAARRIATERRIESESGFAADE